MVPLEKKTCLQGQVSHLLISRKEQSICRPWRRISTASAVWVVLMHGCQETSTSKESVFQTGSVFFRSMFESRPLKRSKLRTRSFFNTSSTRISKFRSEPSPRARQFRACLGSQKESKDHSGPDSPLHTFPIRKRLRIRDEIRFSPIKLSYLPFIDRRFTLEIFELDHPICNDIGKTPVQ